MTRGLRVLYAPRNISGQAGEYAAALRMLGAHAEVWSYGATAFGFDSDRVIDSERLLTDPRYRWDLFDAAVRNFDVFHFQYGRSLLNPQGAVLPDLWDLPLLQSLGKRVFMHWRGSDVRLKSVHMAREPDSYFNDGSVPCDEERIRGKVSIARRFSDRMFVSTPGLLDYVPDAVWIPHAVDLRAWTTERGQEPPVPLVVHAPSSAATKGSAAIDAALMPLQAEGVCRYERLSGLTRDEMRSKIRSADIVVDGLTIGDHGLTSVEAMAAGAVAVAHVHDKNRARNPGVPVVEATVADLREVVQRLCKQPEERADLRRSGVEWARRTHDRLVVGSLLLDAYAAAPEPVQLPYPEWPRSDSRQQVATLEGEVEALRQQLNPVFAGSFPRLSSHQHFVVDRLLRRMDQLERELQRLAPMSPLLETGGRRPSAGRQTLVGMVKSHPRAHRLARNVARRLRGSA